MTSSEFVIWLKGFATAANSYNITPAQWDEVKEQLNKVNDNVFPGYVTTTTYDKLDSND
jgi:hypothetical protein